MNNEKITINDVCEGIFKYSVHYKKNKNIKIKVLSYKDINIKNENYVNIETTDQFNKTKIYKCELMDKIKITSATRSPIFTFIFKTIPKLPIKNKNENENPIEVLEL